MTKFNLDKFNNILKSSGYRMTVQRQAILELIILNKEGHLSIKEITKKVKAQNARIGLATVYRTLELFKKFGIVNHIIHEDGCIRYQLAKPKEKHEHHHLICQICGKIIDVEEDMLEKFEERIFNTRKFTVTNHRVKVYGICEQCSNNADITQKD